MFTSDGTKKSLLKDGGLLFFKYLNTFKSLPKRLCLTKPDAGLDANIPY